MKLRDQHIIIVSNEPWGDTWYSKHNYAYELSKHNKVFFINPPERWQPGHLAGSSIEMKNISPNLFTISYNNRLPALNGLLFRINNKLVTNTLRSFFREQKITRPLFWSFDPYRLYDPKALGASRAIFHAVDKFLFIHWGEALLYRNCDNIFCVSESFTDSYKHLGKPIHVFPHAISDEEFHVSEAEANSIDITARDYALYIGNIDRRIDFDLAEEMIRMFPQLTFVFVGKLGDTGNHPSAERIFIKQEYSNVIITGQKPFKELKKYIHHARLCLAPMQKDHPGNKISHHKIFQYMALGKPVFSCVFTEYSNMQHLLYMNDDGNRLLEQMKQFLTSGEDRQLSQKRIDHVKQFTFANILDRIGALLQTN